jgi:hypothetical protein
MNGDLAFFINNEYPDILNTSLLILATLENDEGSRLEIAHRPDFLKNLIELISNKKVATGRNSLHTINSLAMNYLILD